MAAEQQTPKSYKLILIGEGDVGKSTFVRRFQTKEPRIRWMSLPYTFHEMSFPTNRGVIHFQCLDTEGQEKFGSLRDGYYMRADAAIIMFDVTNRSSYKRIPVWYQDIVRVCGKIPTVLLGNKVDDVRNRTVKPRQITIHRKLDLQYYDVSAKSNYNFEKPFLWLAQKLWNEEGFVQLAEELPLVPPEIEFNHEMLKRSGFAPPLPSEPDEENDKGNENDD